MGNSRDAIVVVDVGSTSVRATVLDPDGDLTDPIVVPTPPVRGASGTVEYDGEEIVAAACSAASVAISAARTPPTTVALATQRASTVLFDRTTGAPLGPVLSWQDIRTTGHCLMLRAQGIRLAPSQSATKLAWLLEHALDAAPTSLAFGTLESFLAYRLTGGATHVTDATNAAVTGLVTADGATWDPDVLDALEIPAEVLPRIVDSTTEVGEARVLPGSPVIAGLIGDQQASLIGQRCLAAGATKITFGTGAMLDRVLGRRSAPPGRGDSGTFPIVVWRDRGAVTWGIEAVALSAGSAIDWLVAGLGLLPDAASSEAVASAARDAGGVTFVPALGGIGTPLWDHGARGALVGLSAATTRSEVVRAVLEGVAHRAGDLVEAVEADSGSKIAEVAVDGGMSRNDLFVQLVANALARPVLCSRVTEATTLGAAMLAGTAIGRWTDLESAGTIVPEPEVIEPTGSLDRERWLDARERSLRTVPALSMLSF